MLYNNLELQHSKRVNLYPLTERDGKKHSYRVIYETKKLSHPSIQYLWMMGQKSEFPMVQYIITLIISLRHSIYFVSNILRF